MKSLRDWDLLKKAGNPSKTPPREARKRELLEVKTKFMPLTPLRSPRHKLASFFSFRGTSIFDPDDPYEDTWKLWDPEQCPTPEEPVDAEQMAQSLVTRLLKDESKPLPASCNMMIFHVIEAYSTALSRAEEMHSRFVTERQRRKDQDQKLKATQEAWAIDREAVNTEIELLENLIIEGKTGLEQLRHARTETIVEAAKKLNAASWTDHTLYELSDSEDEGNEVVIGKRGILPFRKKKKIVAVSPSRAMAELSAEICPRFAAGEITNSEVRDGDCVSADMRLGMKPACEGPRGAHLPVVVGRYVAPTEGSSSINDNLVAGQFVKSGPKHLTFDEDFESVRLLAKRMSQRRSIPFETTLTMLVDTFYFQKDLQPSTPRFTNPITATSKRINPGAASPLFHKPFITSSPPPPSWTGGSPSSIQDPSQMPDTATKTIRVVSHNNKNKTSKMWMPGPSAASVPCAEKHKSLKSSSSTATVIHRSPQKEGEGSGQRACSTAASGRSPPRIMLTEATSVIPTIDVNRAAAAAAAAAAQAMQQ